MAERMPRFDPLTVLGADDVNLISAGIDAGFGVDVGDGLAGTTMPEDAKVVAKVFYADRPSNGQGYVDIEWPGENFEGLFVCLPQLYGANELDWNLKVNSIGQSGASLMLHNESGTAVGNESSVRFMCLVIGWRAFA